MSQHFLLSAKARTLSVRKVMELTDAQAFEAFPFSRWARSSQTSTPQVTWISCRRHQTNFLIEFGEQEYVVKPMDFCSAQIPVDIKLPKNLGDVIYSLK